MLENILGLIPLLLIVAIATIIIWRGMSRGSAADKNKSDIGGGSGDGGIPD